MMILGRRSLLSAQNKGAMWTRFLRSILPWSGLAALVIAWAVAVRWSGTRLVPSPEAVVRGIAYLTASGALSKHIVASLFRVTWGFGGAALAGVPVGLTLGLVRRAGRAFSPFIQILRPISPIAWIPIAILWFGVGDLAAVFVIFLASFFPIAVTTMNAVSSMPPTYLRIARNFGLGRLTLLRHVVLPAVASDLIVGLRLALGIAWLVVVAAEMIAVNSGLGFLIIDSRNAGDRYDLVVAGMASVGAVGFGLDTLLRRLERAIGPRSALVPKEAGER